MRMHAYKLGSALEIIFELQRSVKKGIFLVGSGLLPRCLRYLRRLVRACPPDAEVLASLLDCLHVLDVRMHATKPVGFGE